MAKQSMGLAAFTRPKASAESVSVEPPEEIRSSVKAPARKRKRAAGETVALTVKVRRSDWQRLRQLADAEGTTIQAMAEAGFSAVLGQHGLPPIESYQR